MTKVRRITEIGSAALENLTGPFEDASGVWSLIWTSAIWVCMTLTTCAHEPATSSGAASSAGCCIARAGPVCVSTRVGKAAASSRGDASAGVELAVGDSRIA
eukprot:CAMPEP_0183581442 /NCGR_PEP_ID=MMETSP0371-20130417/147666_1 /TAXON_ID=268820 /ORGANISM="Peridinium aciculiferum, Strain PAER-2" /LENGTH=101 /DNA_ID=CAMNT_0025792117 /DNA_START=40 /DNA_END=342 /DNA_ORIENTATION=+